MVLEFGQDKGTGLVMRQLTTGQEFSAEVKDRYPQLDDVHIEGRRFVEISVELFVELMAQNGFFAVNPATGKTQLEEEQE